MSTHMSRLGTAVMLAVMALSLLVDRVNSLASTDTITWGGDNSRAGYQTNHNMDPSVVGSDQFAQLFKTALPGNYNGAAEQIFSQPLVYTPSGGDGSQYVYFATTQNNVYKLDAKTGVIVASRNLHVPFLTADLDGCNDINPHVGIIATGVIDPDTDTLYLTAKTYAIQDGGDGPQGKPNGRYYLHALDVNDLSEKENFPVDLEGTLARNNPTRSFNGGIHLQRPALLHSGQHIYAGFASHCVQYNFTGWIMGWDKTTGANVERWATEGAGVPNTTPGGGVWMSGGGLASDNAGSMFFATGNGYASQLADVPVNGRDPPTSMEEAAVHMTINDDGSLSIVDFFMPYEKQALDGADKDLGTSPLEILPGQFACGDVQRIGVVTGKSGKTYWLNLDDLGGYKNGPDRGDNVIQVYQNENSVYAGAGVYPLEGGYVYINVIQYPTHVFKFSCNNGVPSFTKVADSPTSNAYVLGVGHGTVTSLDGQPGTGLVWTSDVQGDNLRIYNAIPDDGTMTMIKSFSVPGTNKFTRPVFGDGVVYMGTNQGFVYGFGAPTASPLNCSSPYNFGDVEVGTATSKDTTVTCKAKIAITVSNIGLNATTNFNVTDLPTIPLQVAAGASFSFEARFKPTKVGFLSTSVDVETTNSEGGYSTKTPIRLTGTGRSNGALFSIDPATVVFQEVVAGSGGSEQTVMFSNDGNTDLTILGIQYSESSLSGPFVGANETASGPQVGPFTFENLPDTIKANSQATVKVNFNPASSGSFSVYLVANSNGGKQTLSVAASSGPSPVTLLEFETPDGSEWVEYEAGKNFTFGNVTENTTRSLKLRLTNAGETGAVKLSVTVSKPPFGGGGIVGAKNQVDLGEGTTLGPGESATATLYCSVPKEQWNTDPYQGDAVWTMNTNDPDFGKRVMHFSCLAVSEQALPLRADGLGQYRYAGCFKDNNPDRQLPTQLYSDANNTNAMCIAACAEGGYAYCGTQYTSECWAGTKVPVEEVEEEQCNFACSGDVNQVCGGEGVNEGAGGSYLSVFAGPGQSGGGGGGDNDDDGDGGGGTPSPPTGEPSTNPGVGDYESVGCYTEGTNTRALPNLMTTETKTVAACIEACSSYKYAGVEYGGECWCGNAFGTGAASTDVSECNMPCADNVTEFCGAGNRLNVYSRDDGSAPTPDPEDPGEPDDPPPSGPAVKETVGEWQFQGCWTEGKGGRALPSKTYADDDMSLESCAEFCAEFKYFGVEYGRECYCGNSLGDGSVKADNQADCSFACPGDRSEYCGAGDRLELHACRSRLRAGCLARLAEDDGQAMTVARCRGSRCASIEYGSECWCGDTPDLAGWEGAAPVRNMPSSECGFACAGNATELCGAGSRMSLYWDVEEKAKGGSGRGRRGDVMGAWAVERGRVG